MTAVFERVALIGLGLIAGSMAHAMRADGLARQITGHARSAETRAIARELFCDAVTETAADAAWGQLALHAEGLLEADAQGFAAGRVMLRLTNWDRLPALLVALGAIKPEIAPTIAGGLRAMAAQSPDPAVLALPLDMRDGRMTLGPFPLGEAPRLRPPES